MYSLPVKFGSHFRGVRHVPAIHEPETRGHRRGERHAIVDERKRRRARDVLPLSPGRSACKTYGTHAVRDEQRSVCLVFHSFIHYTRATIDFRRRTGQKYDFFSKSLTSKSLVDVAEIMSQTGFEPKLSGQCLSGSFLTSIPRFRFSPPSNHVYNAIFQALYCGLPR